MVDKNESVSRGIPRGVKKKPRPALVKIADFFMVLSGIGLGFILFTALSFLALLAYFLILFLILFLTLFLTISKFKDARDNIESFYEIIGKSYSLWPYIIAIGGALTLVSLPIYIIKKDYVGRTPRIVSASVILVLYIAITIFKYVIMKEVSV